MLLATVVDAQPEIVQSGGTYRLRNQCSGKLLDVSGAAQEDGAPLIQWTENGGLNQQFKLEATNNGYYALIAQHSQKAVDVRAGGTSDGTVVQQYSPNGTAAQQWKLIAANDGYYKLESRLQTGKVLDVLAASTADGARIQLWTDNGTCAQRWRLELVTAPNNAWSERILNNDGTINWSEYTNVANNYDQKEVVDQRFGPKYKYFHPTPENLPTVWGRTGELPPNTMMCCGNDPSQWRDQQRDFQWQSGWLTFMKDGPIVGYKDNNGLWFAYSGQLLYSPDSASDAGVATARSYADYHSGHGGHHTSAYDLKVSWTPDPANHYNRNPDSAVQEPDWIAGANGNLGKPVAVDRARVMHSAVTSIMVFKSGVIGATGTGNEDYTWGRVKRPFVKLPAGKVPTGVSVTQNNEFALITVWDTVNRKGQVAVVAIEGRMIGGVDAATYWGLPNWPVITKLKIVGYVDLPFAAPTSISVTTDTSREYSGRSYPGDESLDSQIIRDKFASSVDPRHSYAKAGYALVSSRAENKVAFIDLEPLFQYYRKMYLTTQTNFDQTKNEGTGENQWPFTFAHAPEQQPLVTQVLDLQQPTAVMAGFPFPLEGIAPGWEHGSPVFNGKAWITTMSGELRIYNVGGLAVAGAATNIQLSKTVNIGKNPSHIDWGRGAEYSNVFITSRGGRAVYKLDSAGNIRSVLRDSRLIDPISSHASQGIGPHVLSVMDFSGKQAVNYMHKPLDPWGTIEGGGLGQNGTAPFEWTYSTLVPGFPFLFHTAEVI